MWKKTLCIFMTVVIAALCLPVCSAEGTMLHKGDTVEYIFSVGECKNLAGLSVYSYYSVGSATPSKEPEFLLDKKGESNIEKSGVVIWNFMITGGRAFSGEDVVSETFTVDRDCTLSDLKLSFKIVEAFDDDLNDVDKSLVKARVKVNGNDVKTDSTPLKKGDTVRYIFKIGESANVAGVNISSTYNEKYLTPVKDPESLIGSQGITSSNDSGTIIWNTMISGGRAFNNEDFVVETFTVNEDCTLDDANLSFTCLEIFNDDLETLPTSLVTAYASVAENTSDPDTDEPAPTPTPTPADSDTADDSTVINKGDTVEYIFSVGKSDNVAGVTVNAYFDEGCLTPVGETEFLIPSQGMSNMAKSGKVLWSTMIMGGRAFDGEDLAVVRFTANKDCTVSEAKLSFECVEIFNHSMTLLDSALVSGRVVVKAPQPEPSTDEPKPEPSTDEPKPEPSTDEPKPDTDEPKPESPKGIYGDVDGDGTLTASDALMILRRSVGLTNLDSELQNIADVDGDGNITASDALIVLRCSIGSSSEGKAGQPVK